MRVVLSAAAAAATLYALLAGAGNLREHVGLYLAAHAVLVALMLVAWRVVAKGAPPVYRAMLVAAVVFRLTAALAPPTLSDDIYRYLWDGRVQAEGHHPYKFAPSDPQRSEFRDAIVYPRINHPEIPTIYPPLAEMLFAALSLLRAGVTGFKLAFAALDVGVVLALARLLRVLGLPADRVVLYAWNPLAVVETCASGHVEPLGILFVLLAIAWLAEGKAHRAGAALGAAVQAKLLPLLLVPGFARRMKAGALLAAVAVVASSTAPYAIRGPWFGGGALAYAHRWEHGAVLFEAVRRGFEWLDAAPQLKSAIAWAQARWGTGDTAVWDALYKMVWPQELARAAVAFAAFGWAVAQSFRRQPNLAHEARLSIGGAVLLAPTLHPWYLLWVLPLAAAEAAGGWLLMAALVPLQYLAGTSDVPWTIRLVIVLPALLWMTRDSLLRFRR